MNISEMLGPFRAELAEDLSGLEASYREALEQDGVIFPAPEVLEAERLYDAQATADRGEFPLESDGSIVDLGNFDAVAAGQVLRANRVPLANERRLASLAEFGHLSRAGSLLISRVAETEGPESPMEDAVRSTVSRLKFFCQLGAVTEEWGRPWDEIIERFSGPSLELPLGEHGVAWGLGVFYDPFFDGLRKQHFTVADTLRMRLVLDLIDIVDGTKPEDRDPPKLAALTGVFYRHSPEGCDALLSNMIQAGKLPSAIDWHGEMHAAVKSASRDLFAEP